MVEFVAARVFTGPGLDGTEHVPLDLDVFIAEGGVVERSQHVVDNFVHGHVGVLPCVEDATARGQLA